MKYLSLVEVYERLAATRKHGEKTIVLADWLKELHKVGKYEWIYLLRGKVVPDYDTREYGISGQLAIKSIAHAFGIESEVIVQRYKKIGDLGDIAAEFAEKRKQRALFSKTLSISNVFDTLQKLLTISGQGAVEKKIGCIAELLGIATAREARYIIRTLLQDLRVGVADALLTDALSNAFFAGEEDMRERLTEAYDLANDSALVFTAAVRGREGLDNISVLPGRAIKVMLPVKVTNMAEAFRICGKPAALEHKYDGFRMLINYDGKQVTLFTRKLENVTFQFPDVVVAVKKHVKAKSFILDSEVVGYNPGTKRYMPFEAISQRIRRKYDIEQLSKKLPVEINVFDVLYINGKSVLQMPFIERRKLLEKLIVAREWVIRASKQLVTGDVNEAEAFYTEALNSGEEGIMIKALDAPYKQGRRVGYLVKLKPVVNDLDLVIVGAEYGSGKRAGWLTSYVVACRTPDGFAEVGMVSSGLKEKEEAGTSYDEMTQILKPLIIDNQGNGVRVQPKIVVSVTYQNIQASPSYPSGYALRFPRITHYRPDRTTSDIATLADIEGCVEKEQNSREGESSGERFRKKNSKVYEDGKEHDS